MLSLERNATLPVGGRLGSFWQDWRDIGASRKVVRWLKCGYPLPIKRDGRGREIPVPLHQSCPNGLQTAYPEGSDKAIVLENMIQELVDKQAIREIPSNTEGFYSRVFLVPKKSGGWRLIIDLSHLNQFLDLISFNMDTAADIKPLLQEGMWGTSIDLSDAYLHIPIHPKSRKFLCFVVNGRTFQYWALPFGLAPAPYVFSKVMKTLKGWARRRQMLVFQYLDDWFLAHAIRKVVRIQTLWLIQKAIQVGLIVNGKKSDLIPAQLVTFLGERWNLEIARAYPTPDRVDRIRAAIQPLCAGHEVSTVAMESLLGLLVATEKTVPLGRLHFRPFQVQVQKATSRGRSRDNLFRISARSVARLQWWLRPDVLEMGCPFRIPPFQLQIQTDASRTGWGRISRE